MFVLLAIVLCGIHLVQNYSQILTSSFSFAGKGFKRWRSNAGIFMNMSDKFSEENSVPEYLRHSASFSNFSVYTGSAQIEEIVVPDFPLLCRQNKGLCANKTKNNSIKKVLAGCVFEIFSRTRKSYYPHR